jgi:hypothetical protein
MNRVLLLFLAVQLFLSCGAAADDIVSFDLPACIEPNAKAQIVRQYQDIDAYTADQILTLDLNGDGICDRFHGRFFADKVDQPNGPRDLYWSVVIGQKTGWKEVGAFLLPNGKIECGPECQMKYVIPYAEFVFPVMIKGKTGTYLILTGDNPRARTRNILRWNDKMAKFDDISLKMPREEAEKIYEFLYQRLDSKPDLYRGRQYCPGRDCE